MDDKDVNMLGAGVNALDPNQILPKLESKFDKYKGIGG